MIIHHKYSIGDIVAFDRKELNIHLNRGTIWELTSKINSEGDIIPTYTIRISFYIYVHGIPEDKITIATGETCHKLFNFQDIREL